MYHIYFVSNLWRGVPELWAGTGLCKAAQCGQPLAVITFVALWCAATSSRVSVMWRHTVVSRTAGTGDSTTELDTNSASRAASCPPQEGPKRAVPHITSAHIDVAYLFSSFVKTVAGKAVFCGDT
jgi:hypothetical protein